MSVISGLKVRLQRVQYRVDTPYEFVLGYAGKILNCLGIISNPDSPRNKHTVRRRHNEFTHNNMYQIKDVKLPCLDRELERHFFANVFDDTLFSYFYLKDQYDEQTVNMCDLLLSEGLYALQNEQVNVTVEPGDVVIDAGSWIGDFAAYASVKGATVYAFEPAAQTFKYLTQTAGLNPGIVPVKMGLSDESTYKTLFLDNEYNRASSANSFLQDKFKEGATETVETTTLDDFVRERGLERVDFIKADIEGYERHMLEGAQKTLRRFAPKLALCTYHLPDDPEVLARLIKKANPNYNIVQKRKKLYASVPHAGA